MRLSGPVYEGLPILYMAIGALGIALAYLDQDGSGTVMAFAIGCIAEIAAVTIFLRRYDYRALGREYSRAGFETPPKADL